MCSLTRGTASRIMYPSQGTAPYGPDTHHNQVTHRGENARMANQGSVSIGFRFIALRGNTYKVYPPLPDS